MNVPQDILKGGETTRRQNVVFSDPGPPTSHPPLLQNTKLTTMPKERTINPAQAQRKADKAKAVKKGTVLPRPPGPSLQSATSY